MNEVEGAGTHELIWNRKSDGGQDVSAGMYFIVMNEQGKSKMQKMLVVR